MDGKTERATKPRPSHRRPAIGRKYGLPVAERLDDNLHPHTATGTRLRPVGEQSSQDNTGRVDGISPVYADAANPGSQRGSAEVVTRKWIDRHPNPNSVQRSIDQCSLAGRHSLSF